MPPHLAGIGEDGVTFIKAECATRVFTRSVLWESVWNVCFPGVPRALQHEV